MSDSPIVTLRGQRSDDWDSLYAVLNQKNTIQFTDELPYMSDETFRERYSNASPGLHRLIGEIVLPSGRNRFVGMARLQVGKARRRHVGQMDCLVHPDHQNTNVAESFLEQVIMFADRWLALRRLQVVVYEDDMHGLAMLEQQGFVCEATLRRYGFRDGAYRDACLMARLNPERAENIALTPAHDTAGEEDAEDSDEEEAREPIDILVRGMESADWEDVAEMLRCVSVYFNTLQVPYLSRDITRDRLENPPDDVHMFAAEVEERVVGMLGLHFDPERHPHATSLGMMVHEDYQGCGVGSALMAAAIELAERWHNISRISLEVYLDNEAGIALYQKFGFEVEGILREYAYRDGQFADSYLMARVRGDRH